MNKYIEFKESDLVWVILAREGSPQGKFSKLKPRIDGPFKVLKWIGENACKIELPTHLDISDTFNMVDWSSSYGDNSIFDSRFSLFQLGEHETKVSSMGPNGVGLLEFRLAL